MKKYISCLASLALFFISACTSSTPVSENTSTTQATSQTTTTTTTSSNKPEDGKAKVDAKSTSGNATGWQDYSSVPGKFSVQMPNKPQEQSQEQKTDIATVKMNMVLTEADGLAYFASYADFPNKFADADIQEKLTGAVNGIVKSINGEVKSSKASKLGEIPCRDFEGVGKVQETNSSLKGRVCLANNTRFYQLFTLGTTEKFSNADADRFIASFKINN